MIPADVYKEFCLRGTDWANAHAVASQLEDGMKPLLSQLTIEAKLLEGCSMAEATAHALSSGAYRQSITEAVEGRREANIAKVRYDACKALFEAQRTAEASERAAMRSAT
jgi:hypothetical protein